jgi:CRP-like cAMP-binding protein
MSSVIRAVKVFESLSDVDCAELARFMRIRQYQAGAMVFERGKLGDSMLVVADGALSVVMPGPRRRSIEVARVGVGEVLGETSCLDPAPRSATILAAVRTTTYELGRKELARMRQEAPSVATTLVGAVIRSVTLRLRRVDERIERELAGHLAARLPELRQTVRSSVRSASGRASSGRTSYRRIPSLAGSALGSTGPASWTALLARLRGSA